MIETLVLIPLTDNQGRRFPKPQWRELEERLLAFGGVTRDANVTGVWQSSGRVYRDRSRQYIVALDSWWQLPAWLDLVDWARPAFRQEALYVKVAGIPEIRTGQAGAM